MPALSPTPLPTPRPSMTATATPHARSSLTPGMAVLLGTLAVGVLDLLDPLVFFGARGVPPVRILHSIASGLLGRAAFAGGLPTALSARAARPAEHAGGSR
ncbi:MAG: hypothetical protein ABW277_25880 [Longimicrobiaceae bacterium]